MVTTKANPKLRGDPGSMVPIFLTVDRRTRESIDVITLEIPIGSQEKELSGFQPGQFNMLYVFGIGEVPISISGDPGTPDRIVHTIRTVGPVSEALTKLERNEPVGVRGPYGNSWPVEKAVGCDVLLIAGGIGLAPLRPALYHLMRERERYGRVALLYGARSPEDLLFRQEIEAWRRVPDLQVRVTVDRAERDWIGDVGVAAKLLSKIRVDPPDTVVMMCGPEVMIRATAAALSDMEIGPAQIFVSMERNMKCAVGWCGRCQFGPHFLCKDGPIFRYDQIAEFMTLREI